jgi:hypothetical protein
MDYLATEDQTAVKQDYHLLQDGLTNISND